MEKVLVKRGTKTQVQTAANTNLLSAGEVYLLTDERRLAVGVSSSDFEPLAKQSEILTSIPTATTTTIGGVKVDGTTITIDGAGKITAVGGGSGGLPSAFSTFSMVNGELIVEHSSSFTLSLVNGEFIVEYT